MASQTRNLSELMADISTVDVETIDKTRIKQLYLDVTFRCLEEEVNPKAMEVALRAIAQLSALIDEDPADSIDDELRAKMPANMIRVLEGSGGNV